MPARDRLLLAEGFVGLALDHEITITEIATRRHSPWQSVPQSLRRETTNNSSDLNGPRSEINALSGDYPLLIRVFYFKHLCHKVGISYYFRIGISASKY